MDNQVATEPLLSSLNSEINQNINARDSEDRTALYRAIENGQCKEVKNLLQMGAEPGITGPRGRTALHCALASTKSTITTSPELDIVEQLLECRNIDFDVADEDGCTALHHVAGNRNMSFNRQKSIVEKLVNKGVRVDVKNVAGQSPKKLALERRNLSVAIFLAEKSEKRKKSLVPFVHPQAKNLLKVDGMRWRCFRLSDYQAVLTQYEEILASAEGNDLALAACCLKKCGDTCLQEAEYRLVEINKSASIERMNQIQLLGGTYRNAYHYYNRALQLITDDNFPKELASQKREPKELIPEELLLQRLEQLEKHYIEKALKAKFSSTSVVSVEERRKKLAQMEKEIDQKLREGTPAREIVNDITTAAKDLTRKLIQDCFEVLGEPPCGEAGYAIIGGGSMEQNEMSFYSDMGLVILVDELTPMNEEYFLQLVGLLQVKILVMGGSGIQQGFRLDDTHTSTYRPFLNTPEQVAKEVLQGEGTKEYVLSGLLGTGCLLEGEEKLLERCNIAIKEQLAEMKEGKKWHRVRALEWLKRELEDYPPKLNEEKRALPIFDLERELFHLPIQAITKLCWYYGINEAKSTWDRLNALLGKELISEETHQHLSEMIEKITRLRVHAYYKTGKDRFCLPWVEMEEIFKLPIEEVEALEEIYEVLFPFYEMLEKFCKKNGNTDVLQVSSFSHNKFIEQGEVCERKFEYVKAKEYYHRTLVFHPNDPRRLFGMGRVCQQLAHYKEAIDNYEKALELQRKTFGAHHFVVVETLYRLGRVFSAVGKDQEAVEKYYQPALHILEKHHNESECRDLFVSIVMDLGKSKRRLYKEEEAVTLYARVFQSYQVAYGDPSVHFESDNLSFLIGQVEAMQEGVFSETPRIKIVVLHNLAKILHYLREKNVDLQEPSYRLQVYSLCKEVLELCAEKHPDRGVILQDLADFCRDFGEYEKAKNCYEKALVIYQSIYGESHPEVASVLNKQGEILSVFFKNEDAEKSYTRARCIYEQHSDYGKEHPFVAEILNNLGQVWTCLRKPAKEILDCYDAAARIYKTHYGETHPRMAETFNYLGAIWSACGSSDTARDYHKKALKIYMGLYGEFSPFVAETLNELGKVWREYGKLGKAQAFHKRALGIYRGCFGEKHFRVGEILHSLGRVWSASRKYERAQKCYQQALKIRVNCYGDEHPLVAETLCELGNSCRAFGINVKAIEYYDEVLAIRRAQYGDGHFLVGEVLSAMGNSWYALWNSERNEMSWENAEKYWRETLKICEDSLHFGKSHLWEAEYLNEWGKSYLERKDYGKSVECSEKALEIYKHHPGYGRSHFLEVADVLNNLGLGWSFLGEEKKAIKEYFNPALKIYVEHYDITASLERCLTIEVAVDSRSVEKYGKVQEWCTEALVIYQILSEKDKELESMYRKLKRLHEEITNICEEIEKKVKLKSALEKLLKNDPTLTELNVKNTKITGRWAKVLAAALGSNQVLRQLDLGGESPRKNKIGAEGAKAFAVALSKNQRLHVLNLHSNKIGDEGIRALVRALEGNQRLPLKQLYLWNNQIGDEGIYPLAQMLAKNQTLQVLELSGNDIHDEGAKALAVALDENQMLQRLDISLNQIGNIGVKALSKVLGTNQALQQLDLGRNHIGDAAAKALAVALEKNETLQLLNLHDNHIGDEGVVMLAKAIEENSQLPLHELSLEDNQIGDTGAEALALMLQKNQTLRQLSLWNNEIGDGWAQALALALVQNQTLQQLYIGENWIGDGWVQTVARSLANNQTLQLLDLEGNIIGTKGAKILAVVLEKNKTLQKLDLRKNRIEIEGGKALKRVKASRSLKELWF